MSELVAAVEAKNAKEVKALLAGGVDPNTLDRHGRPVLHVAVQLKSKTVVKALLAGGADPGLFTPKGYNALHLLAQSMRDPKIGQLMVDAGVDLDAIDTERFKGKTALHHAVLPKKLEFADWLLAAGASPDVPCTYKGESPLMQLLRSNSGVMSATEQTNALWLIEQGADVNTTNELGSGTLHLAAENGSPEMVNALLEAGAMPVVNSLGSSPLRYTMRTHNRDRAMWDLLLELGCELEERSHGETVVMYAQCHWNPVAVAYCIERGADLTARDADGHTVLERARDLKQAKLVKVIEAAG